MLVPAGTWPAYAEPGNALNQQKPEYKGFESGHGRRRQRAVFELAIAALHNLRLYFVFVRSIVSVAGVVADGGCHGSGPQVD
jgi:hypothetical protein